MSAVTVKLTNICSGGNHLTFSVTGDATYGAVFELSSLTDPIEEDDKQAFLRVITKLARMGRTQAQTRTLLQAGVTITV